MNKDQRIPVRREDDNELLGFIVQDSLGWEAQTIFSYPIMRTDSETVARTAVREQGLAFLMGAWEYLDVDDQKWHTCILKEVYEHRVVVIRTNAMGYQDPDDYKTVVIKNPSETNLIKS